MVTGIICEYNPLHLGHSKQINAVKQLQSDGDGIVCLMSGNYVQRGAPAIIDKMHRAKAAVLCGADLVLELPVPISLSSAEGFAAGGVMILSPFCDRLCFGAETSDKQQLLSISQALLDTAFPVHLRKFLNRGISFPAARQAALEDMGLDATILSTPNNILAVEYCKAILQQNAPMETLPIHRYGNYHDTVADPANPSATSIRAQMLNGNNWLDYIPTEAQDCFRDVPLHSLSAGERSILAKLRCMTESDFSALPYGSEGLWRKLMYSVSKKSTLEQILTATKSKRYTRSRLDRMLLCAFLGISNAQMLSPAPYIRALAFNDRGRQILNAARQHGHFPNIGEPQEDSYQLLENLWGDLYGLFAITEPEPPGRETQYRVYYHNPGK